MFGVDDALIAGVAAPVIGGLIGGSQASGDRQAAIDAYKQSVDDYTAIGIPPIQAQQIVMQKYQSAGQWTPELQQAVQQGPSQMGNISTDPNDLAAQKQALSSLQNIGASGGMTLSDRSRLEQQMGDLQAKERGSRQAILQDAQQRGGYGSGAALAAQLANQQNSSNQAHSDQSGIAAQAQQRALQAIQGAGQLGGQMQQQEFGQKAQQAQAQDAINQWNAQNAQAVRAQNQAYSNQAGQYNLGNQQNIMNSNTGLSNQQELYNKQLPQQQFNNQLALTQGKANARAGQASNLNANAQATANQWAGMGSAVAQGATAYGQMQNYNNQAALNRQAYGTPAPKPTGPMADYDPNKFTSIS